MVSKELALKFCEICNWAYECWVTHKHLFDENSNPEANIGKARQLTARLSVITQEYVLLQICKLHDPAIQKNSLNLTIDYILRFADWGDKRQRMQDIQARLSVLHRRLVVARHKTLCHNDLETLSSAVAIGDFPQDLDVEYFALLQEFADEVHSRWLSGPYPFNDLAKTDVDEFIALLSAA